MSAALAAAGRIFAGFTRYSPFFSSLLSRALQCRGMNAALAAEGCVSQELDLRRRLFIVNPIRCRHES